MNPPFPLKTTTVPEIQNGGVVLHFFFVPNEEMMSYLKRIVGICHTSEVLKDFFSKIK